MSRIDQRAHNVLSFMDGVAVFSSSARKRSFQTVLRFPRALKPALGSAVSEIAVSEVFGHQSDVSHVDLSIAVYVGVGIPTRA